MKTKISLFSIILITLLASTIGISTAKVYVAEPYLVQQPAYAGMTFYVYRPHGIEKGWCVTFDGFAVTQVEGKIWVYGTMQSGELTKTGYVVGSVNPALAGIIPYFGAESAYIARDTEIILTSQPYGAAPGQTARQAYIPDWSVNPSFLAITNWKSSVDRIGILRKYNIPMAWKGDNPTVIHAWTGKGWTQLYTHGESLTETIRRSLYRLLRIREKGRQHRWYAEDIPIIIEKTIGWGYLWMGEIYIKN